MTALLAAGLFVPFCTAQVLQNHTRDQQPPPNNESKINAKPKKRGPRAIAVVEFMPGGKARLVPIALWINDRFYDASLYGANPEPMALEPETVYEATAYGEPTGLFTVTTPEEVKGSWVADGTWKPHLAMDEKMAQQKSKEAKPKPKGYDVNSERPVLKRPGDSSGSSSQSGSGNSGSTTQTASSGSSPSAPSSPEPSDRPVLKKPTSSTPDSDGGTTTAQASPSSTAPTDATVSASSPDEGDPNRPVLRRGKPQQQAPTSASATTAELQQQTTATQDGESRIKTTMAQLNHQSFPAISDANAPESRSMMYSLSAAERANKADQLRALALDELGKFSSTRHTPALPKNVAITNYDLRVFDLDFSNSPTFVLTAALPIAGAKSLRGSEFNYYVTVVAREDINGTPIKIFSSVTDSNHLDAYARMEIIDAVDADANGRGDLLFRQYSDGGISYGLYRVYPYDLQKVFEGGASL